MHDRSLTGWQSPYIEYGQIPVLMAGYTLHTDILGARATGMATLLVTDHGSLAGMDIDTCIEHSGISPDFITPSI